MRGFPDTVGERAVRRCAGGFFDGVCRDVGMSDSSGAAAGPAGEEAVRGVSGSGDAKSGRGDENEKAAFVGRLLNSSEAA